MSKAMVIINGEIDCRFPHNAKKQNNTQKQPYARQRLSSRPARSLASHRAPPRHAKPHRNATHQKLQVSAPGVEEKDPAVQLLHETAAVSASAFLPAGHSVHAVKGAPAPYAPAGLQARGKRNETEARLCARAKTNTEALGSDKRAEGK